MRASVKVFLHAKDGKTTFEGTGPTKGDALIKALDRATKVLGLGVTAVVEDFEMEIVDFSKEATR